MLELGEFLQLVGMTLIARLLAGINRCARTQLHQRLATVPAKCPRTTPASEKPAPQNKNRQSPSGQQNETDDLGGILNRRME